MGSFALNIGYNNSIVKARILAIISADAAPARRLREEARQAGRLIDATNGRKTRSVIVMDTTHVVLSAVETATLAERVETDGQISRST